MKPLLTTISLLAVLLALWGTCGYVHRRGFERGFEGGYSQGANDEYLCWKQMPTDLSSGYMVGRRGIRLGPGGKPPAGVIVNVSPGAANPVNAAPVNFSPK